MVLFIAFFGGAFKYFFEEIPGRHYPSFCGGEDDLAEMSDIHTLPQFP